MNNKVFCEEYVKRIPRPIKRKTNREMIQIVEHKQYIDTSLMFNDKAVAELYPNDVSGFVYQFIRDNQALFIEG